MKNIFQSKCHDYFADTLETKCDLKIMEQSTKHNFMQFNKNTAN